MMGTNGIHRFKYSFLLVSIQLQNKNREVCSPEASALCGCQLCHGGTTWVVHPGQLVRGLPSFYLNTKD